MKKINSIEIFFNNVINSFDFSLGYAIVNSYILFSTRLPYLIIKILLDLRIIRGKNISFFT